MAEKLKPEEMASIDYTPPSDNWMDSKGQRAKDTKAQRITQTR